MPTKKTAATPPVKAPAAKARAARARRGSGRPARISREAILEKSMELLAKSPVDDFMLKTVAQELGTVSMAIYNYFSSREELLATVADEVGLLFKMPKPKASQTWQQNLRDWLWAFKRHADQYPVIYNTIMIEGKTTAGWIRITTPVTRILMELGLRDKQLALACYRFVISATTLIHVESVSGVFRRPLSFTHFDRLTDEEQQLILQLRPFLADITDKEAYESLFAQLIRGIEEYL